MRGTRHLVRLSSVAALITLVGAALMPTTGVAQQDSLPLISKTRLLEIARVDAPPLGTGLRIHADFPAGHALNLGGLPLHSLTAAITPEGDVEVIEAHAAASSTDSTSLDGCRDTTFAPSGVRWSADDLPVSWRYNRRTTPANVSKFLALSALRKAHQAWPRSHTKCNNPEEVNFKFNYAGLTGKRIDFDGVNTIDFGKLGSKALAVNYTWYKGDKILEVDMRLNKIDYPWQAKPTAGSKRYIIGNVVTHELGHQLGLADLSDPHGGLTMFARIAAGETSKMLLGRGDLRGAQFVAP